MHAPHFASVNNSMTVHYRALTILTRKTEPCLPKNRLPRMTTITRQADIPRLKGWNAGHTTSSVETNEGGVNNFIYASIFGVCMPGRDQSCFLLRLFSFSVLNNVSFLSVQNQLRHTLFAVDEFSRSWFVVVKLKLRALVRGAFSEPKLRVY